MNRLVAIYAAALTVLLLSECTPGEWITPRPEGCSEPMLMDRAPEGDWYLLKCPPTTGRVKVPFGHKNY